MKRLLVANVTEEGRWGGPQRRIALVGEELHKHEVDTVVILPDIDSAKFHSELVQRAIQFKMVNLTRLSANPLAILRYIVSFVPDVVRLVRLLRRRPYDLVHNSGGAWQIKGALAGRLAGLPVVWHLNDTHMPPSVVGLFHLLAGKLATAFIVTADRCRRYYLSTPSLGSFPVFHLQAPVNARALDPDRVTPDARILSYPGIRVVSVANINPIKGFDYFANAARILLDGSGDYSFVVVGPVYDTQQAYFDLLKKQVERLGIVGRFHFLGAVDDVASVMAAADIYVCSSVAEAGPMTLWEAMSMERAVVSTDVGDVASYVSSGVNGHVVPARDVQALADAIADLATKPELRREFGRRAREVVLRELEIGVIGARAATCYRQLVDPSYEGARRMVVGLDASNIRSGGGLTHLVELLHAADPRAYGIDQVIVWGGSATLSTIEERDWLRKVHVPHLDRGLPYRVYWQRFTLKTLLKASRCSLLFVPGGMDLSGFRPMIAMSQNLLPFDWPELRRFGWSLLTLKFLLLRFRQCRTFREASGVIYLSQYARDAVLKVVGKLPGRDAIVPHGINPRFLLHPRQQRKANEFSAVQPCRVLYVSNVDVYKHQWQVAEALAQLRSAGVSVVLDLVGPPGGGMPRMRDTLGRVDPEGVFITYRGPVPYKKLHELYASADIGVFASSCETFGQTLTEAMGAGLPIACSNRSAMPEILGDAGVYFDPERPGEIAAAIRCLIESPELRAKKAKAAFERALRLSWVRCADETLRFLADVYKG